MNGDFDCSNNKLTSLKYCSDVEAVLIVVIINRNFRRYSTNIKSILFVKRIILKNIKRKSKKK